MNTARKNLLFIVLLIVTAVSSSFSAPLFTKTKPLTIQMPVADGKYAFVVDGKKQVVEISNETGKLQIPAEPCVIRYTAEDGVTNLTVFIEQETSRSFLLPAVQANESEVEAEWEAVILGNPVRAGKVMTQITGPMNSNPTIEIYDLQGRSLVKKQVAKNQATESYTLDVPQLSTGILLVKVSCDNFSQTLKVLHTN
ncbi:T9SS type A sorting domain-containing protein [Dyadobacter flavalbus]|uniref:T9SS type A sorting domain-containing protein n=1 Tax=Dyadobacter flavalbus TaxID=2579942 RepID=A0A5M8QPR3_9BACT|nr:T9SS type A sorting domain-containing protein [Dyadobacter flavalbus]KAA6437020.1 T9SS type A sorting domain-containing protein [Dyadobacter flavalbus]KAA6439863.1 T9SS type A sorting domain-containing protein [Dyadobacter flavalbus]